MTRPGFRISPSDVTVSEERTLTREEYHRLRDGPPDPPPDRSHSDDHDEPRRPTFMDRKLYKRWRDHPIRHVLKRAQAGEHIYGDELDDLRLPDKVRKALDQAIEKCQEDGAAHDGLGGRADTLSPALVDALPEHHETAEQHQKRRADMGDPDALQAVKARDEAEERMVSEIRNAAATRGISDQ